MSVACRWRKDADRYSPREEEEEEEGREPSKCGAARLRALYRGYEARNARYPRPHPASLPFHRRGDRQRERRNVLRYRGFASTVAPLASRLEKMTSNSRPRLNDQDDNDEDHDCSKLGWIRSLRSKVEARRRRCCGVGRWSKVGNDGQLLRESEESVAARSG